MKTGRTYPRLSDDALRIGEWNDAYMKVCTARSEIPCRASLWEMYNYSDLRTVSSSFLRCTNLSLNYRFPGRMVQKALSEFIESRVLRVQPFVIKDKAPQGTGPGTNQPRGSLHSTTQQTYSMRLSLNF